MIMSHSRGEETNTYFLNSDFFTSFGLKLRMFCKNSCTLISLAVTCFSTFVGKRKKEVALGGTETKKKWRTENGVDLK